MDGRFGKATVGHIRLQTAPQAAAQAIRESIISGELHGGDRIIEQKWLRVWESVNPLCVKR